jgi:hypothetical protein
MGRVHRGQGRAFHDTLAEYWERYLQARLR